MTWCNRKGHNGDLQIAYLMVTNCCCLLVLKGNWEEYGKKKEKLRKATHAEKEKFRLREKRKLR